MVRNIAHRGARSLAPENTLPAIIKAWEVGADAVEVDVAVSRDGKLFIHHDATLLRTTNVRSLFPNRAEDNYTTFTLDELRTLDAGTWYIEGDPHGQIAKKRISQNELQAFRGVPLPTLEEVLLFVQEKEWHVNIEIKQVPTPMETFPIEHRILKLIKSLGISANFLSISSFSHDYLLSIKKTYPEFEVQALIGDEGERVLNWGEFGFDTYNANVDLIDIAQIVRARENGSAVNLFTVNTPEQMRHFIKAGVQGLFTDYPQILTEILKDWNSQLYL